MSDLSGKKNRDVVRGQTDVELFKTQAFRRLDEQLERDLDRLVKRWSHMAAPSAIRRPRPPVTRFRRPK
jgi:hypothetical protein